MLVFLALAYCAFTNGFAKAGFAGVGMLNMPLLTWAVGPRQDAVPFVVGATLPLLICGDALIIWKYWGHWDQRVFLPMIPGAFLGVCAGAPMLKYLAEHEQLFCRIIGVLAIAVAVYALEGERRRPPEEQGEAPPPVWWVGLIAGFLTGIFSTVAHQGGLVTNIYLVRLRLTKERFAATAIGLYAALNLAKVVPYSHDGYLNRETLTMSGLVMPLVLAGVLLGAKLVRKIDPKAFASLILWLTVAAGVKLTVWP